MLSLENNPYVFEVIGESKENHSQISGGHIQPSLGVNSMHNMSTWKSVVGIYLFKIFVIILSIVDDALIWLRMIHSYQRTT